MKEIIIPRNTELEIMKFFLNTSIPRIVSIKNNIESIGK